MHRKSILRTIPCDLKKLPIGAREAFVLSQVHGRSSAEDVAEAAGLELEKLLHVARQLVELGALAVDGDRPKTKRPSVAVPKARATEGPPPRKSERALVSSGVVPVARKHPELRSLGFDSRAGFVLSQIDGVTSTGDLGEITGLSEQDLNDALRSLEKAGVVELVGEKRRASKAAMKAASAPPPRRVTTPAPDLSACALPEADRAHINQKSAELDALDYYAVLGVERDADAKALRRAFHKLAAQYHPDRFFGKKLGSLRATVDRIFIRLTLAYDTLSKKETRDAYDATLPPPLRKAAPPPAPPPPKTTTRKSMRAPRAASVRPPSVRPPRVPEAPPPVSCPVAPPAPPSCLQPSPRSGVSSSESRPDPLLRAYAEKKRRSVQDHVDVFVRAAKEAIDRDDPVAAANNYRLAIQCSDDPALRAALDVVDAKARARVRDKSLGAARAAEQGARWGEAATQYTRAYGVHPEAWVAERAANALRLEGADLRKAAQLAEHAVLAEPQNVAYRVTLGEVYFDAGLLARAAGESARAIALAPNDLRANLLAKQVARGNGKGKRKGD